jgi:hypothetical protein
VQLRRIKSLTRERVEKGLNPLQPTSLPAHTARLATVDHTTANNNGKEASVGPTASKSRQEQTKPHPRLLPCGPAHQASQWNDDNEQGGRGGHACLSPHARAASARVTTHLPSLSHEVKTAGNSQKGNFHEHSLDHGPHTHVAPHSYYFLSLGLHANGGTTALSLL